MTTQVQMLMVNKEAQQNRTRTVSPAAIPSKANYRVKSKSICNISINSIDLNTSGSYNMFCYLGTLNSKTKVR